jgi:predicted SpoU family rRNA methylase
LAGAATAPTLLTIITNPRSEPIWWEIAEWMVAVGTSASSERQSLAAFV